MLFFDLMRDVLLSSHSTITNSKTDLEYAITIFIFSIERKNDDITYLCV